MIEGLYIITNPMCQFFTFSVFSLILCNIFITPSSVLAGSESSFGKPIPGPFPICINSNQGQGGLALISPTPDRLVLGGAFSRVGPCLGAAILLDPVSGQPVLGKMPQVRGTVYATLPDERGGWYLGGNFQSVGNHPRQNLAHVLADGTVSLWRPKTNRAVRILTLAGDRLFIAGDFTSVNGQQQEALGALDLDSGKLLDWKPAFRKFEKGEVEQVLVRDDQVFIRIGPWLSVVDRILGTVRPFESEEYESLWDMKINLWKNILLLGGSTQGGSSDERGGLILGIDILSGKIAFQIPLKGNSYVDGLHVFDDTLYLSGNFDTVLGEERKNLAAIDLRTVQLTAWKPSVLLAYRDKVIPMKMGGNWPAV